MSTTTRDDISVVTPVLPGKLGDPNCQLRDDVRADPRMIAAMAPLGLDGDPEKAPFTAESPYEHLLEFIRQAEPGYDQLFEVLYADLPAVTGVSRRTEVITGVDGNDISLYIHAPDNVDGPVPCVVHTHGGGMVMMKAADPGYVHWRDRLAESGVVAVGVEFRNGGGALGDHPFPAGLNDSASAAQWVAANREALGVSNIVLSGESGGGNLCLATAMKAMQEGWIDQISGVYSQCPYIYGDYGNVIPELPSLVENDGYFLEVAMMGALAKVYTPESDQTNPLAWPYHAEVSELEGMPPTVISVNELDPLRDEGLAFYRKLVAAGVSASSRTVNGTCHGGDCIFATAMPEVYAGTLRDIAGFANSLS